MTSPNRSHASLRRWVALVTLGVVVLGLFPVVVSPAVAQEAAPAQGEADEQQRPPGPAGSAGDGGTGSIGIHLVECPSGFQSKGGAADYDTCHSTPIEGVEVSLTSTTTDTPVDTPLQTERVQAGGPGVVTFGDLPAGDYEVAIDLSEAEATDVFAYCSVADGDEEIAVSPNDVLTGTLAIADGQGVICDWYITPAGGAADASTTIDLLAYGCDSKIYQCSAVNGLPATGTGPGGTIAPTKDDGLPAGAVAAIVAGVLAAPLVVSALIKGRNRRRVIDTETVDATSGPIVTSSGKVWMRFK